MCVNNSARLAAYTILMSIYIYFADDHWSRVYAVAALPPTATCPSVAEIVGTMTGGRKEKRSRRRIEVLLFDGEQPSFGQRASTQNISSIGRRVQTARPWKPGSRLRVKSTMGDLRATARVVYCQCLAPNSFALGLELARTRDAQGCEAAWIPGKIGNLRCAISARNAESVTPSQIGNTVRNADSAASNFAPMTRANHQPQKKEPMRGHP